MEKPNNNPQLDAQEMLMRGLDFTPDDLDANRAGHMSERQRRLFGSKSRTHGIAFYYGFLLVVAGAATLSCAILSAMNSSPDNTSQVNCLVVLLLVAVPLAGFFLYKIVGARRAVQADIEKGDVVAVGGVALLDTVVKSRFDIAYTLRIADLKFEVRKAVFYSFKHGDAYTIYCAPHSEIMLSAEPR